MVLIQAGGMQVVMGTGALGNSLWRAPHRFHGLNQISIAVFLANIILFVLFMTLSALRYTCYPHTWRLMLGHKIQSLFLGLGPVALATIVNACVLIVVPTYGQWALTLTEVLFWVDVVLSVLSCFGIPILQFHCHELSLDNMTAVWILPIIPAIVASASGGVLGAVCSPGHAAIIVVTSYVLWGIGMSLSSFIMVLYFHRLLVHSLPLPEVIVSAFLPLGAVAQGCFAVIELANACKTAAPSLVFLRGTAAVEIVGTLSVIVALTMWGLGIWWLIHGSTSLWIRAVYSRFELTMALWGLVFPFGVLTLATIDLSQALTSTFFSYLSSVFVIMLVMLWLLCAYKTLEGVWTEPVLRPPCLSKLERPSAYALEILTVQVQSSGTVQIELADES